jgi:flagellin
MRINTNIMAMDTFRNYSINNSNVAKSVAKLSSGYSINSASDDAAGLAISEKMRAQISGLNTASKNSQDAISLLQTAEGSLDESQNILQRMRELSVQSSSDTNDGATDRAALDQEFQQLKNEINDIANKTTFNGMNLLNGNFGVSVDKATGAGHSTLLAVTGVVSAAASGTAGDTYTLVDNGTDVTITRASDSKAITYAGASPSSGAQTLNFSDFGITITLDSGYVAGAGALDGDIKLTGSGGTIQTGANAGDTLSVSIGAMDATTLGLGTSDVTSQTNAASSITAVNNAINAVSTERSKMGALMNRLADKVTNLNASAQNLQAAESRIRDVDMAQEMTTYTQNNILVQASTAMLAQANSAPQSVLKLLQ